MKSSVQAIILFAAAALVACLATAINAASPQEILLPFNDLLPPLLEESIVPANEATEAVAKPELPAAKAVAVVEGIEAASNGATVAMEATSVVKIAIKQTKPEKKPLKKSYYQQQQQLKQYDQHQNDPQHIATGRRPPKGALPTLTPFPRHLKKLSSSSDA